MILLEPGPQRRDEMRQDQLNRMAPTPHQRQTTRIEDTETKEKYIRAYCEFCEQHEIAMMGMPNNTSAGGLGGAIAIGL